MHRVQELEGQQDYARVEFGGLGGEALVLGEDLGQALAVQELHHEVDVLVVFEGSDEFDYERVVYSLKDFLLLVEQLL